LQKKLPVERVFPLRKPVWLKTPLLQGQKLFHIKRDLRIKKLFTVCEEAKCPNMTECWNDGTATFMILGETCTRACRFCHVNTGNPRGWLDEAEPQKITNAIKTMGLHYVVMTMVDRDDLVDGGAEHIFRIVKEIRRSLPSLPIELLGGDFQGDFYSIDKVLESGLNVFAHNLETVQRLSPRVRDGRANYRRSLDILDHVKKSKQTKTNYVYTKTGIMLGLGESDEEVIECMKDMRKFRIDFLTIGQYLQPTKRHLSVKRFVSPEDFDKFKDIAIDLGFLGVSSGPLVRSSYQARQFYEEVQ